MRTGRGKNKGNGQTDKNMINAEKRLIEKNEGRATRRRAKKTGQTKRGEAGGGGEGASVSSS